MGCIVYDGPIPRRSRGRHRRPGLSDRGLQRARRRRRLHVRLPARLARRRERSRPAATWANACGAFAVSRLLCSPEYPTWEELQYLPEERQPAPRAAQGRGDQPYPLGDDAPARQPVADGARHRPSRRSSRTIADAGRRRPRRASAPSRCWRWRPRRKVAGGRAGYGMLLDENYGREALFDARQACLLWIGRPVELPGSRPLRFEFSAGHRLAARRMAGRALHQVPLLLSSRTIRPALKARAAGEAARAVRGGAQGRPRTARRDHRRQARHARRRHDRRARCDELYALGIKPDWWKLEPQASAARLGRDRAR